MHLVACVHDDLDEAREVALRQFAHYPRRPFYRNMFMEAGFPEASDGTMSPAMADAILIAGNETALANRLRAIAATGVDEVLCSIAPAGSNKRASEERTLRALGELSQTA
jgi:alkanesulfonate monooxygenase SsuD/methylene tetrahydromethanopterin reductase-like flavin-dependent oxidoreductase (luciferase family)